VLSPRLCQIGTICVALQLGQLGTVKPAAQEKCYLPINAYYPKKHPKFCASAESCMPLIGARLLSLRAMILLTL